MIKEVLKDYWGNDKIMIQMIKMKSKDIIWMHWRREGNKKIFDDLVGSFWQW